MSREARRQLPNRAARRVDTLGALADAAAACVDEDNTSFAELSVERLARRAGISRASFYLYFEDKGELVRGWHQEFDAQVTAATPNGGMYPAQVARPSQERSKNLP
ncbi:hypothetical protein C1Y40_04660 [Mycobacterium talmoniae]|uniref:HTH tetR-type domain-containing protein n=1 Tax=Mycobacterium talmoniae TaxID=1858794 RepID=A0A2S8BET6_9MYCO|nr:hypothetical protein C1Y40_04660 [Mycobacterium talmoniae]